MPVVGSDFRGRGQRNARIFELANQNVEQRANSTKEMQAVGSCENVEETASRIAGHEDALSNELPPGDKLTDQKKCAEGRRYRPKFAEAGEIKPCERAASPLQREAAGNE